MRPGEEDRHRLLLHPLNDKVREEQVSATAQVTQPVWSWAVTVQARASLSRNKSTGRSAISAETLQALSSDALHALHDMLHAHFHSSDQPPLSWTYIRRFLLPKVKKAVSWDSYRGICLLNVLSKMYMAGIMVLLKEWEETSADVAWREPLLFGFQAECQCEDIFMCLQQSVASAREWPRKYEVCAASTDTKQAFDFVTPAVVAESMYSWSIPAILVRGLVRESLFASAEAVSSGIPPTTAFGIQTCIRQGGMESPWAFNLIVRTIVRDSGDALRREGLQLPLLRHVALLGWADNLLFVGRGRDATQRSIDVFTDVMHSKGLSWKASWVEYMTVDRDTEEHSTGGRKRKREEEA